MKKKHKWKRQINVKKKVLVLIILGVFLFVGLGYSVIGNSLGIIGSLNLSTPFITVTLNPDDGSENPTTMNKTIGSNYGPLPTPTKTGYTFEGWNGKNEFNEELYNELSEYKGDSAYKYAEIKLKANTTYKVSVVRYNDFDGKNNGYLLLSPSSTINANWTAIAHPTQPDTSATNFLYTTGNDGILYIGYNSSTGMTQEMLDTIWENTDVQLEEGTVKTAYEPYFITDDTKITRESSFNLNAIWKANSYTVSFDANEGTGGQSQDVTATYDSDMPTISTTAPTRTNYKFLGWYDAKTNGTKYYNADGTSAKKYDKTSNTTLYAHWELTQLTLTVKASTNITSDCNVKVGSTNYNCKNGCQFNPNTQYTITCTKKSTTGYQYTNSDNPGSKRYKLTYAAPSGFSCSGDTCTLTATLTANKTYTVTSTESKTSCALRDSNIKVFSYDQFKGCTSTGTEVGCNLDESYWKTNGSYCRWSDYTGNGPLIPVFDRNGNQNAFNFRIDVSGGFVAAYIISNDPNLLAYNYQFIYGMTLYDGTTKTGTIGPIPGRLNGTGSAGAVANAFEGPYLRWVEGSSYCP